MRSSERAVAARTNIKRGLQAPPPLPSLGHAREEGEDKTSANVMLDLLFLSDSDDSDEIQQIRISDQGSTP